MALPGLGDKRVGKKGWVDEAISPAFYKIVLLPHLDSHQ